MPVGRKVVIVTDDPVAAAMLSYEFSSVGYYTVVVEPPRMMRSDASNEVARTLNVISRISPKLTIMFGLATEAVESLSAGIKGSILPLQSMADLDEFPIDNKAWAILSPEDAIQKLVDTKTRLSIPLKAVVYNGPVDVGFVVAANYAIYHNAKLIRFEAPEGFERDVVRKLNIIDSIKDNEIRRIDINSLKGELESHLPSELVAHNFERTLLITEGIPYGLVWPKRKTIYSNRLMLGSFLAHNVYEEEWGRSERIGLVGLYVADRNLALPGEYESFEAAMLRGRGLTKKLITNHPKLTELDIMTIPYDVMYIATHGKQLEGYSEIYEFTASDKITHRVKVKRAAGEIAAVMFIELVDGVAKDSDEWTAEHGQIWGEFTIHHLKDRSPLPEPLSSERTRLDMRALVLGNEAEHSPFAVQRLASNQRPIVIANACGSWTDMASLFMFAGASAYIGTLWETLSGTAFEFARIFNAGFLEKDLSQAFFDARDGLQNDLDRMNYVLTGSFENKYDSEIPFTSDGLTELRKRVTRLLDVTSFNIENFPEDTPSDIRNNAGIDKMWYQDILKDLDKGSKTPNAKTIKLKRKKRGKKNKRRKRRS